MTDILSAPSLADLPGSDLDVSKMPGHWLLARLGKRVLRPGGLELTRALLDELAIGSADEVVDFAPGLGVTARMILQCRPQGYKGVERDAKAAQWTARQLPSKPEISVVVGRADQTSLLSASASVVVAVGFRVLTIGHAPMHLLRPLRLIHDEGILGTLRLARNLMLDNAARRRVLAMWRVFECYRRNLSAIYIVAQKH